MPMGVISEITQGWAYQHSVVMWISLFLTWHNEPINNVQQDDLQTSISFLTRSVYVLLTSQSIAQYTMRHDNCCASTWEVTAYGFLITWSILSKIQTKHTHSSPVAPHSSPVRARYWVSFVYSNSDFAFCLRHCSGVQYRVIMGRVVTVPECIWLVRPADI